MFLDALNSRRPHKPAFLLARCREILNEGRGTQFDPNVLEAFFAPIEDETRVAVEMSDNEPVSREFRSFS